MLIHLDAGVVVVAHHANGSDGSILHTGVWVLDIGHHQGGQGAKLLLLVGHDLHKAREAHEGGVAVAPLVLLEEVCDKGGGHGGEALPLDSLAPMMPQRESVRGECVCSAQGACLGLSVPLQGAEVPQAPRWGSTAGGHDHPQSCPSPCHPPLPASWRTPQAACSPQSCCCPSCGPAGAPSLQR